MIEKDMLICDILEQHEAAGPFLAEAGMRCIGCASASGETLEAAALEHGIDPVLLLRKLNFQLFGKLG